MRSPDLLTKGVMETFKLVSKITAKHLMARFRGAKSEPTPMKKAPAAKKAEKKPEPLKGLYRDARAAVVAAAEKALAAVEQKRVRDPAGAKRDLLDLVGRLGGTGLEEKAKALLATLG